MPRLNVELKNIQIKLKCPKSVCCVKIPKKETKVKNEEEKNATQKTTKI